MAKNIGVSDQGLRYCIAIACAVTAYNREQQDAWFWVLCGVAVAVFLTAITGFSLLYNVIGEDTLENPRGQGGKR